MNPRSPFVSVLLLIGIILSACGLSQAELDAKATQVAANIFATQTAQAPTATPTLYPKPDFHGNGDGHPHIHTDKYADAHANTYTGAANGDCQPYTQTDPAACLASAHKAADGYCADSTTCLASAHKAADGCCADSTACCAGCRRGGGERQRDLHQQIRQRLVSVGSRTRAAGPQDVLLGRKVVRLSYVCPPQHQVPDSAGGLQQGQAVQRLYRRFLCLRRWGCAAGREL